MERMVKRFGKLIVASFIVIGIGIIVFILSLPLYIYYDIDSDVLGFEIILIGLVIFFIGLIRSKKQSTLKLALLVTAISLLSIPILGLIGSLIYYLITGKPLGD